MKNVARDLAFCGALAVLAAPSTVGARAGVERPAPVRPAPEARSRIVVLGDSLAVSPSPSRNFVAELESRLDEKDTSWAVVNAGVHGDTTANGLKRLDTLLTPDTRILVLELGGNDGLRGVAPSTIENNLADSIAT